MGRNLRFALRKISAHLVARFDVYAHPEGKSYLLDVQADLLTSLNTRVVVPLMLVSTAPPAAKHLNPVFEIQNKRYVMVTQFLASVPVSILKTPVSSLALQDTDIIAALDMLTAGI